MAVEIYIEKELLENGQIKFDLMGKNLPANLLGLASDLKFKGDLNNFHLDHWDLGEVMTGREYTPIFLLKENWSNGRLVMGLTQKADHLKEIFDGKLISIYFSGQGNLDFDGFNAQVLSSFSGQREDINGVFWNNAQNEVNTKVLSVQGNSTDKSVSVAENPIKVEKNSEKWSGRDFDITDLLPFEWPGWLQTSLFKIPAERSQNFHSEVDFAWFWWWGMGGIAFLLFILIGLYFRTLGKN